MGIRYISKLNDIIGGTLSKTRIMKHVKSIWQSKWANFCLNNGAIEGLLGYIQDPIKLISTNKVPLTYRPKLVGSLCVLLTGHTRLQLHLYKLKLTHSPTCICLEGDESPIHFV